ncbi:hypothetical protein [Methylobacterium sp. CCH5-D2]|uniref:hypothetical protein n=1 Tax=Methylobacterium sp. CCH5-D2 TaxID=1768765 RepID=UPI00082E4E94|nr:hypothetical protein [Methylobacterium sp. CCH5-D2]
MSAAGLSPARRGFLRGLVSLPLIGGGVTLIGAPTAVAQPVTPGLLDAYADWLAVEYGETLIERNGMQHREDYRQSLAIMKFRREWCQENPTLNAAGNRFLSPPATLPSARAAVVLAAAGQNWREGGR